MSDVFLSASVPGPKDQPFASTADPLRIHAAVRAVCLTVLRNGRLVWGGHPAITPMVMAACENMGEPYKDRVVLYQSEFFSAADRPQENDAFSDIRYTARLDDMPTSLAFMRRTMFESHQFSAGIFIGGKQGIFDEFELFRQICPKATLLILPSTGGAAATLGAQHPSHSAPGGDFVGFLSYLGKVID